VLEALKWDVSRITPVDVLDHVIVRLPLTVEQRRLVRRHAVTFILLCVTGPSTYWSTSQHDTPVLLFLSLSLSSSVSLFLLLGNALVAIINVTLIPRLHDEAGSTSARRASSSSQLHRVNGVLYTVTPTPVSTWMGDCLRPGKLYRCIASHRSQLSQAILSWVDAMSS